MKKQSNPPPPNPKYRPPPPPPPPRRTMREGFFSAGMIETKESKQRTEAYRNFMLGYEYAVKTGVDTWL